MPTSPLKIIKRCAEFCHKEGLNKVPSQTRGIYALLRYRPRLHNYDVVYIGMAGGERASIKGRLRAHARSKRKATIWTHFSVYEVWDNITEEEIRELEGLFRHIYRKDTRANKLNVQKSFKKIKRVRVKTLDEWIVDYPR